MDDAKITAMIDAMSLDALRSFVTKLEARELILRQLEQGWITEKDIADALARDETERGIADALDRDEPEARTVQPLMQWLKRELPIYLTQVGHGATLDEFRHHVGKLLPDQPPEVTWVFGLDGYLDCGDLDRLTEAVWERHWSKLAGRGDDESMRD